MPTTPRNKQHIERLGKEGIIRFLYRSAPTPSTAFYMFEVKDEHGDTQERKVPERDLYSFLAEAEAAAKEHSHRFPPPVVRR